MTNVYVNNELNYAIYDLKKTRWTEELLNCCDMRKKYIIMLLAGPYKRL